MSGVTGAAREVGSLAQRAKTPLVAGGAALAGLAGGLALRARSSDRGLKSLQKALPGRSRGFSLPTRGGGFKRGVRQLSKSVSDAAQRADQLGKGMSKAANAVQKVSDTADETARKA